MAWRTIPLRDREVVDALVDPNHAAPSPELAQELQALRGSYYWSDEPDGRHLVLSHPTALPARERWALHALLFVVTLFTTTLGGAVLNGTLSSQFAVAVRHGGAAFLHGWTGGLSFALPLLGILLCHELGHYLTARRYHLDVSPPYFIPGPPAPVGIGTLGAFIRLRTILTDRRQLLDVGAAGPLAGFLIALPVLWIGFALSRPDASAYGMEVWFGDGPMWHLGDSPITRLVRGLALGNTPGVILHPTAVAGWFGMFVTALNLLPMAQLDGGHILYAAVPRRHELLGRVFWVAVMLLGWFFWSGWLVWGVLVLMLSRGRLGHPPVLDAYRPLPQSRGWLAWASLVLFLATFAPMGIGP